MKEARGTAGFALRLDLGDNCGGEFTLKNKSTLKLYSCLDAQ